MEALVLDPSYQGTAVEAAARRLPCPVEWHPGFRLTVEELRRHPHYRGQEFVDLGARIADGRRLDPRIIGDAAAHRPLRPAGRSRWYGTTSPASGHPTDVNQPPARTASL